MFNALRQGLGSGVTLVVPTQTADNSFTSRAYRQATAGLVRRANHSHRAAMPGFDLHTTPAAGVGALAEYVRRQQGAIRSNHPQCSFAALGPDAAPLMERHHLDCHLGEESPLGALYDADASILLLGVGYASCTAFHLPSTDAPGTDRFRSSAASCGTTAAVKSSGSPPFDRTTPTSS
jgi:aminoglycoside 3-N-acetyltransferase